MNRFDPSLALAHLRANDEVMAELIERVGPFAMKIGAAGSLFEALLRSIIYQQLHGRAAATIHGRVLDVLRRHGGPTPRAVRRASDEELRGAGLSRGKLAAIRDLSAKCAAGRVPDLVEAAELADEDLVARLTEIRGVGPWTAHMILIFQLGRPDVLPIGDFAIRSAFRKVYRKRREPKPEAILRHARRWQPYRSVASWYLWRSLDTAL